MEIVFISCGTSYTNTKVTREQYTETHNYIQKTQDTHSILTCQVYFIFKIRIKTKGVLGGNFVL